MKDKQFVTLCFIFAVVSALTSIISLFIGIIFYDFMGGIIASGIFTLISLKWFEIAINFT